MNSTVLNLNYSPSFIRAREGRECPKCPEPPHAAGNQFLHHPVGPKSRFTAINDATSTPRGLPCGLGTTTVPTSM